MNLARFAVRNPVAVNLLMWAIVVAGAYEWFTLTRAMFPNSDPELVLVSVRYPGATPEEVEKTITLRIERVLEDLDGIDEVASEVLEGSTAIRIKLEEGADRDRMLNDIRTEIDKVTPELPEEADDPEILELRPFIPVINLVLHGDVSEERLLDVAEDVEDELLALPEISEIRVSGTRDREILIEIQPERLEEFGLTFEEVGRAISSSNLDLPGGQLETASGNVRVRTLGESDRAIDLESIVVRARPDGSAITLAEVARVREGFEDKVERGRFHGRSAILLSIFKTPEQDAIRIADRVKAFVARNPDFMGGAVELDVLADVSRFISQRLDLMVRNARFGLLLVAISLAVFLDLRVAFWVAVGLPISFLGTFVAMDALGVTVNLMSLFGLIVVLGLIVDDAIVIGEHIFTKIRAGMHPADAAVEGATEVAWPVLAAVATTIIAFLPLAFIAGTIGSFMRELPLVVIAALTVSLVEALLILPAHLGHRREKRRRPQPSVEAEARPPGRFARFESRRLWFLESAVPAAYERVLRLCLRWRYVAIAASIAFSASMIGLVVGGVVPFVFLPKNDAETILVNLEMASGTPEARTTAVVGEIEALIGEQAETESIFSVVGTAFSDRGRETAADPPAVAQITLQLRAADVREEQGLRTAQDVTSELRRRTAAIPGIRSLRIQAQGGGPHGNDIELRVRGDDQDTLTAAVAYTREVMAGFEGVGEIDDDLRSGKLEARFRLRESARALGLTTRDVALQLRRALFGFEAQDLQADREEVTVRAVLPEEARTDLSDLSRLRIATPSGARVPLEEVADLVTDRGYASISRVNGKRAITITAEVDEARANVSQVTAALGTALADLGERFPGVGISFEGRQKETRDAFGSLAFGFPIALLGIYAILAVIFRSYMQPLLVMCVIPFAFVGAVVGHWITGFSFTLLSMIGSVALAGIVVNDSLILVDFINRQRLSGRGTVEALVAGGRSRLRAILLTSITTIAGLAPIMLERSFQAQFLIPMAVSIVFGLAFATGLTLLLLPTIYLVAEDLRATLRWLLTGEWKRALPEAVVHPEGPPLP